MGVEKMENTMGKRKHTGKRGERKGKGRMRKNA